jgi:hypothetical protein
MSNSHRDAPAWRKTGAAMPLREETGTPGTVAADRSSPPTQIARDRDDYLGETTLDVGRQTSAHEHELFVSCNPAPALQQQFEHLRPVFIAVHDVGTASSRKLLSSLASASGRVPQKLVIRRQGYGTALATVHFVELPSAKGTTLRMYSTDCETEPSWRQSLAHMLLAFSRLGVIMVGDMGAADIASVVVRLRDSMARGPWHNDQLLLLPLGSASSLVNHGMELARGSVVNVRTTPQVARAADAWGFISGAWNRLTDKNQNAGAPAVVSKLVTGTALPSAGRSGNAIAPVPGPTSHPAVSSAAPAGPAAVTEPGDLGRAPAPTPRAATEPPKPVPARPLPDAAIASLSQPATADILRRYVRQVSELAGVLGCAVFDAANGNRVAYAGSGPSAADLASKGAELMAAILKASSALELGRAMPEAAITLDAHHLILRAVPRHPGLALHVVLDKVKANLTLVRLQVLRLDGVFEEPG